MLAFAYPPKIAYGTRLMFIAVQPVRSLAVHEVPAACGMADREAGFKQRCFEKLSQA